MDLFCIYLPSQMNRNANNSNPPSSINVLPNINEIIYRLSRKPGLIFLIDSVGALATAFSLIVVLRQFNDYIGMPDMILVYLSAIAACYCIYSAACFLFLKENHAPFIKAISLLNLLYCVLTMGLLIKYSAQVRALGIIYFLGEIVVVCVIAFMEWNVAKLIANDDRR